LREQEISIPTPDGTAGGFLFHEQGQVRPGVLFLTDIVGIRPSQREMARRVAAEGYTVLEPNIFYRTGQPPLFDFQIKFGEERTTKRLAELSGPLTPEAMERDAAAFVDFLAAQPSTAPGPVGAVGLCFSGAVALRAAAVRPERLAAAASFHGGRLCTDTAASPHLALPRIKARLYFGHAFQDPSMPAEAIEKLDRALREWGGRFESEVYPGAHHGWTVPDAPSYNQAQAERAFEKLGELLEETLRPA
jgi:carboxymethylenebutenolidase